MVIAISGILIGVGVPMVLSYYHGAQVTAGAQQVRTLLNLARQIAIDQKTFVCVQVPTPTQMAFYVDSTCTGTPWVGSITDGAGNITLQPGFTVSASDSPVFDYLGGTPEHDVHGDKQHHRFDADRLSGDLGPGHDSIGATDLSVTSART